MSTSWLWVLAKVLFSSMTSGLRDSWRTLLIQTEGIGSALEMASSSLLREKAGWYAVLFFLFFPNQAVNCGQSNCSWCTCAMSLPTCPLIFLSESRWDVEELLLRHSFLPQCSVHPLLWRLWYQAVCSRWTALFRPARQLRRIVELASSPPSLCHYIFIQIFTHPVPPSLFNFQPSLFSVYLLSPCFAHTWTQEHDIFFIVSRLQYYCCVYLSSIPPFFLLKRFLCTSATFFFVICYSFGFF